MSDQLARKTFSPSSSGAGFGAAEPLAGAEAFRNGRPDALFTTRTRAGRTGLQFRDGFDFDGWTRIGVQVGRLADASAWWIGDWLIFGQKAFPDRYRSAIDATGFSYQTLRNYAWVAAQFELYRRRDNLSFGHHAEVASLPEEEQEEWLLRAIAHRWSRNELRSRLRRENRAEVMPIGIALQVEESRHERWQAAAIAHQRSLSDWMLDVLDAAAAAALETSQ